MGGGGRGLFILWPLTWRWPFLSDSNFLKKWNLIFQMIQMKFFRGPFFWEPFIRGPIFQGLFIRGSFFRGPFFRGSFIREPFFRASFFRGPLFQGLLSGDFISKGPFFQRTICPGTFFRVPSRESVNFLYISIFLYTERSLL